VVLRVDRRVRTFPELAGASTALADELVRRAEDAVAERGRFRWVISGGRTPLPLFALLAGSRSKGFPWRETEVFFADERCVPPGDPNSNFGAAWSGFLSKVPVVRRRVHRMPGEVRPIAEAARRYARAVGALPDLGTGAPPLFDVVLLGIGPDGHTASLFPGQRGVTERKRTVVAVPEAGQPPAVPRISLTPPALSSARNVWFLVAGDDKRAALRRIFRAEAAGDPAVPASMIRPPGPTEWFLDAAAALGLGSAAAGR
jgi:6-phosphogluconolactonase